MAKDDVTARDVIEAVRQAEATVAAIPHSQSEPDPSKDQLKELADQLEKAAKSARDLAGKQD